MGTLKYFIHGMTVITAFGGIPSVADASKASNATRIAHAKELVGSENYEESMAQKSESLEDVTDLIEAMSLEWLPKDHKKKARTIANAIVHESEKHGFDPVFILSVIQFESRFNPEMRGAHSEIGLMQLKPTTAHWIAQKMNLKYEGENTLLDPVRNITIGIAFLATLRGQFDPGNNLYLAAYNMGARRVRQIVADDRVPTIYAQAVLKRYFAIYSAFESGDNDDVGKLTTTALNSVRKATQKLANNR